MNLIKPITVGEWVSTDDSCFQYVKKISETEYSLIELACYGRDEVQKYEVYEDTIDLQDYFNGKTDELLMVLSGFGYESLEVVRMHYGDEANQVMAECLFEYYGSHEANQIFIGVECEAIVAIMDFISEKGQEKQNDSE